MPTINSANKNPIKRFVRALRAARPNAKTLLEVLPFTPGELVVLNHLGFTTAHDVAHGVIPDDYELQYKGCGPTRIHYLKQKIEIVAQHVRRNNQKWKTDRRILTKIERQRIAEAYQNGESQATIAKKFKRSECTIRNVLRHLKVRTRFRTPKNFSAEECKKIADLYISGQNLVSIAATFQCSAGPIRDALKKQNIKIRPRAEYLVISPENSKRTIELYHEGLNLKQIAKKLKLSPLAVRSVLVAEEIDIRPGTNFKIHPNNYQEIGRIYAHGYTIKDIATALGCIRSTVRNILKKIDIPDEPSAEEAQNFQSPLLHLMPKKKNKSGPQLNLTETDHKRMIELYEGGLTSEKIADRFGCSESNVFYVLRKYGVKRRFTSPAKLSVETHQQMVEMYEQGQTSNEIANVFGCSAGRVLQILNEQGVKMRSATPSKFQESGHKISEIDQSKHNITIRNKLSQKDQERLVRMYENGLTSTEIAAEFACHQNLIEAIIRKLGVQPRNLGLDAYATEDRKRMAELYEGGMCQDEIAAHFECGRQIVNLVLRSQGVTFRPVEPLDKFGPRDRRRMIIMHENKHSESQIAEEFGCDNETVATAIRIAVRRSQLQETITETAVMPVSVKQESPERSLSHAELLYGFWQADNRAIEMMLLPPNVRSKILEYVNDAVLYACDQFR